MSRVKVSPGGSIEWVNEVGDFHREEDKPAVIRANGSQFWVRNGKTHRDNDKPAVVYPNGEKEYWVHGRPRLGTKSN